MVPLYAGITLAYILGSIPTALIAGYLLGRIDIRTTGSFNAGATNLYRSFGLKPYIAVLAIDMAKGFAATYFIGSVVAAGPLDPLQTSIACGLVAVLGHIFSIFAGFKGGKGVATAAGMMLAIIPVPLLIAVAVYAVVAFTTHYVSLGSIGAAVSIPVTLLAGYVLWGASFRTEIYVITLMLTAIILATHRSNIGRLMRGEERKTYFFKKS